MPSMPSIHRPKGMETAYQREQRVSAHRQGYTRQWSKARARFLQLHPLCTLCEKKGRVTAANVVDHRVPHRGDMTLFWDESGWQSLCEHCHNSTKRAEENAARRALRATTAHARR